MTKTSITKPHVVSLFLPQRCHPGLYMFPVFLPRECLKSTPEHTCFLSAVSKSLNSRTYVLSLSFFPRTIKIRTQARIWSSFLATQCRSSPSYVSKWDWKRPDVGFLSGLLKNIRVSTTSAGLLSLFCSKIQPRIRCAVSFFCSKSLNNPKISWSPGLSTARNRRATRQCAVSFFCSKISLRSTYELELWDMRFSPFCSNLVSSNSCGLLCLFLVCSKRFEEVLCEVFPLSCSKVLNKLLLSWFPAFLVCLKSTCIAGYDLLSLLLKNNFFPLMWSSLSLWSA